MASAPPTAMPEVRIARPGDAGVIAAIHVAAWRHAYARILPAEALAHIPPGDREALWRRAIAAPGPRRRVLLAGPPDGAPRGFAAWSPSRDDDRAPATTAELCALYVHPDAWGAGLGRVLVDRGAALARADGFATAILWVARDNGRARGSTRRKAGRTTGPGARRRYSAPGCRSCATPCLSPAVPRRATPRTRRR